jgi:hypothetical protein
MCAFVLIPVFMLFGVADEQWYSLSGDPSIAGNSDGRSVIDEVGLVESGKRALRT